MKSVYSIPALICSCHYNGLSLIQALGRHGVPVWALDAGRGIGTYSRFAMYRKVPDPLVDEKGFVNALVMLCRKVQGKPLIIPTNDHWAEALSRHKSLIAEVCHVCVSDYEVVSLLLDKERFGRWAQINGFLVPHLWSVNEALDAIANLPYPVAVKAKARRKAGQNLEGPAWSRAADRLRFRACANANQLRATIEEADRNSVPIFIQQVVRGRSDAMHSIGLYANEGRIRGMVYGRKLRGFPPAYGDCVVGLSEQVPEWARTMAKQVCAALCYTGFAEFDVMVDVKSGQRFLIEINPRSWGWVGVAAPAGVDLPWLAYREHILGLAPEDTIFGCSDGRPVFYAKALADLQNTLIWYRFTEAKDWVMTPFQWWATFKKRKGVFAEFAMDDPLVAVISLTQAAKLFAARTKRALQRHSFKG